MKNTTTFKVITAFILGVTVAGAFAIANTSSVPVVKACVDNKTKALFIANNGNCSKGRSAIDIGATGANVKSIAQLISPSVVSIKVTTASAGSGTGSGSVYKSNSTTSFVITNNHVVDEVVSSGKIEVELNNGDVLPAALVGRNSEYDLAVVSINRGNLPEIPLGNSSNLSIGDAVIAFGSPLGLSGTVTSGIVSALNRPVTTGSLTAESYMDAIQTDAAINPGNSGGPLVDAQGRIVGVNSAIATLGTSSASGNIGLGFSIPINQAKRIADELINTGKSTKPLVGISFDNNFNGVGARVAAITAGKAAERAGMVVGSIVKRIDGFKINDAISAIVRIRAHAPGDQVVIVAELPSGESKSYTFNLDSAPALP
jgi:putative serine protease PepD